MKSRVSHDLVGQNTLNITGFTVVSDNQQCCRGTLASDIMRCIGLVSRCWFNFFPGSMETSKGRNGNGSWFGSAMTCGERGSLTERGGEVEVLKQTKSERK